MHADAVVSIDQRYRYTLTRSGWPADTATGDIVLVWVMLNPSTADARVDDPTIRKVCAVSRVLGYRGIQVVNVCAWRDTSPANLIKAARAGHDIFGPGNEGYLRGAFAGNPVVMCAWGAHGADDRIAPHVHRVRELLREYGSTCMQLGAPTLAGQPRHPLYLSAGTEPRMYNA